MKKVMFLLLAVMSSLLSIAQDVITTMNGSEIQVKVLKISDSAIEYKEWSNQDGDTLIMNTSDIFMIKYQNGEKDVFGADKLTMRGEEPAVKSDDLIHYDKSNYVTHHGVVYKYTEVGEIIKSNPAAYKKYVNGKTMGTIGCVFACVGGAGAGFGLAGIIAKRPNSGLVGLIGLGVCFVSLPIAFVGEKNIYRSFEMYNDSIKNSGNTAYWSIGISETGGLAVRLRF